MIRLAFVSGLNDKKLAQKLAPLQAMEEVECIDLFRRRPFSGSKVRWIPIPSLGRRISPIGDAWRLVSLVRRASEYDAIIGCHQRFHGVYAAVAGRLRGKPVIQLTITDPAWIMRSPLGSWTLRQAGALGFRGRTTQRRYGKAFGPEKPTFVPQNVWEPTPANRTDCRKEIDLLYVGGIQGYKSLPTWLRVAAEVKRDRGSLRAKLVGGDRPTRRLRKLVRRLNLVEDVEFAGYADGPELDALYDRSRILMLTSKWEGLPMVALEAMARGLPVVATDTGDVCDVVDHGHNGWVVPVGDVKACASAVTRLLRDAERYDAFAAAARRTAERFAAASTLEAAVREWRGIFTNMNGLERCAE